MKGKLMYCILYLGVPTLKLSLSPSVTEDTLIDAPSNTPKSTVKSIVNPNRIIYYTTARTVELTPYKAQKTRISPKQKLNPTSTPRQKQNPSTPSNQKVTRVTTVPSKQTLTPTQKPTAKEKAASPSNSKKTKVVSPDMQETPKSSSQPSGDPKIRMQVLGRFDSNLYQLAKDRNLLSTALKDANPENLEILLAFTQKQKQK